jgi:hypothetical protein
MEFDSESSEPPHPDPLPSGEREKWALIDATAAIRNTPFGVI